MNSVALLVVLPFVGALFGLVGKLAPAPRLFSVAAVLPLLPMIGLLAVSLPIVRAGSVISYAMGGWPEPIGIALHLDGLAWLSSALIVVIAVAVCIASFCRTGYGPSFFFFLMILISGMQMVVLTGDIFTLFVSFEIVALAAYVLIAYDQTDAGLLASLKYLILSTVGILFFLFGVFLIYRDFGTLSLATIRMLASERGGAADGLTDTRSIHFAVAALCVGIGVRTAFIPFHTWLPEAHAYAPHPVSAILSGVVIKVSFLAMIRIVWTLSAGYLNELLLWIGAITSILAVVWALAQSDTKRLLAYHSISQMGYVLAAIGAASATSLTAGFSHAVNHALFKSLLFLVAGTAIRMTGERDLFRSPSIGRHAPILAGAFIVGALSISGIPPFNGFASKQLVAAALGDSPAYLLLRVTAVGTMASFIKVSRIVVPVGTLTRRGGAAAASVGRRVSGAVAPAGPLIHVPAVLLALLCVLTGLFAPTLAAFYSDLLAPAALRQGSPVAVAVAQSGGLASFYKPAKLIETAIVIAAGWALYRLVLTPYGKRVAGSIKHVAPELRTVLLYFVAGLGLFALFAYV